MYFSTYLVPLPRLFSAYVYMGNFRSVVVCILVFNMVLSQDRVSEQRDLLFKEVFFEAIKFRALERYEEANQILEEHLIVDSAKVPIYHEIAQNCISLGQYQKAMLYLERGLRVAPDHEELIEKMLQLVVITKDDRRLKIVYTQIVKHHPQKISELIDVLIYNEKYSEAMEIINNGTLTDERILQKNKIFFLKKDYKNALKTSQILLNKYPYNIRNYMNMVLIYSNLGRTRDSEYYVSQMNEKFPNHKYTLRFLLDESLADKDYERFFVNLEKTILNGQEALEYKKDMVLKAYEIQNEHTKYADSFKVLARQMLKMYPRNYHVLSFVGDCMLDSDKEFAMECYRRSVEEGNTDVITMQRVLIFNAKSGHYDKLYTNSKSFLANNSGQFPLYYFNGLACLQLRKDREAIEVLEEGLVYFRGESSLKSEYYSVLAQAYHNIKEYMESDQYYEEAIAADKSNLVAMNNYSYFLSLRGEKLDRALDIIKKVCETEPNNVAYLDTYAWVLYKNGKFEKSREVMERALTLGGLQDPDILEHYGDILHKLSEREKAVIYWRKAIEKGGDKEKILKKIEL